MLLKKIYKPALVLLLMYVVIGGFMMPAPRRAILNETIRNLHFHVPMWFAMTILLAVAVWKSVQYLRTNNANHDLVAREATNTGLVMGVLGLATGSLWARFTWGTWWTSDAKLNATAAGMLIYLAYLVLRGAFTDGQTRARIAAIYSIFAFTLFVALIFVMPRLAEASLHPGNGGNPAFNAYELDTQLRMVFYPAVLAWAGLGWWITELRIRLAKVQEQAYELMNQ